MTIRSQPLPGNLAVLASAGSGKTFQLTNRCVKLMLLGVEPERILALTFTRKAAGEFLDEIVRKVARAAADESVARRFSGEQLGIEPVGSAEFTALLRKLTSRLHLLSFGTLDSFFVRILQAFPLEFGFGGGFDLIEDAWALDAARESICDRVFGGTASRGLPVDELVVACRHAQFGEEDRSFARLLSEVVGSFHRVLLEAPEEDRWGNAETIWPAGSEFLLSRCSAEDLEDAVRHLEKAFEADPPSEKQRTWWEEFVAEARTHVPGRTMATRLADLTRKILDVWSDLESGETVLTVNRGGQKISPAAGSALREVVRILIERELQARLRRTRGIWKLLDAFEDSYHHHIRRRGLLTFDDIPRVLAPGGRHGIAADRVLDLEYRLDGRFDHWLIDEFQDTSREQWRVIANLVDEVLQDSEGRRTYFQVGDTKQAIYGWRGGDPHLFADVRARYGEALPVEPLSVSWRSVPAVLEPINRVFGGGGRHLAGWFPSGALEAWEWQDHRSAEPLSDKPGFACLVHPAATEDGDGREGDVEGDGTGADNAVLGLVLGVLREVDPLRRGLSCAILVENNKAIGQVVDYLRAHAGDSIPVGSGARARVAVDNPVTAGILSLLRFAAHPGDSFAWEHVRMTPLAQAACDGKTGARPAPGRVARSVLGSVHAAGFEPTIRDWAARAEAGGWSPDPFSVRRIGQLADAARAFDRSGDRDIDRFLAFAEGLQVAEPPARGVVQVMTIHASKGLGFDAVILPGICDRTLTESPSGVCVRREGRDRDRVPRWVLDLPRGDIARADPELRAFHDEHLAEAGYDSLCRLYVAMTRAKRGLYLVRAAVKPGSKARNFGTLLCDALGEGGAVYTRPFGGAAATLAYAAGDRLWFESPEFAERHGIGSEPIRMGPTPDGAIVLGPVRSVHPRSPSDQEAFRLRGGDIAAPEAQDARVFGRAVHAVLAGTAWLDDWESVRVSRPWRASPESIPDAVWDAAEETVRSGFAEREAFRNVFRRPEGDVVLWREQAFETLLDGEWISGVFDRVVIVRDEAEGIVSASLVDFKTDRLDAANDVASQAARHSHQIGLYRRVLERMTELHDDRIACSLLFTHPGLLHRLC